MRDHLGRYGNGVLCRISGCGSGGKIEKKLVNEVDASREDSLDQTEMEDSCGRRGWWTGDGRIGKGEERLQILPQ